MIDDAKVKEIIQLVTDHLIAVANGGDAEELYNATVIAIKNSINEVI